MSIISNHEEEIDKPSSILPWSAFFASIGVQEMHSILQSGVASTGRGIGKRTSFARLINFHREGFACPPAQINFWIASKRARMMASGL
jgi:hypothetical protein